MEITGTIHLSLAQTSGAVYWFNQSILCCVTPSRSLT